MLAGVPGQKLFDKMAASPESLAEEALACGQRGRCAARCRWCATCRASTPKATYFQFARNMVKGMAEELPAPPSAWTPWNATQQVRPMAWPPSARCSST